MEIIEQTLREGNPEDLKALFSFDIEPNETVLTKFNLWARYFFGKYFSSEDAPFHKVMDNLNLQVYRGKIKTFSNIAFRGASKTARTKLFIAFCIANDLEHFRRYFKVLCEDGNNSAQITTDIYNMLISPQILEVYPEIFAKTHYKREERMTSFTTSTGIKLTSDIVGTGQRGQIQEEARPDFIWFEDFENRKSLRSAITTNAIWLNMEEARTGLSINGSCIYTCNYVSEMGNVHKLVGKDDRIQNIVLTIPIIKNGIIAWNRYTKEDIDYMKRTDEDFEGERLCQPSASKDIYFDREKLDEMLVKESIKEIGGFKMFKEYNSSHRYAGGHDVAGGVGLDSSTSVFIDFDTIPAQVVATFESNTILPEAFGDEIVAESNRFGGCLVGIENNKFDQTILKAKILKANLFMTPQKLIKAGYATPTTYGWNTNSLTKNQMLSSLREAIESGLIELNDQNLIQECKSYTRNDLIDVEPDARLTTRHFDLMIACCIAWMMKDYTRVKKVIVYPGLSDNKETNPAI